MNESFRGTVILAILCSLLAVSPAVKGYSDEVSPVSPFGQLVNSLNPANWQMPKMPSFRGMLPQPEEKARIKKKKDGFVAEVSKTASGSWARTKEAFNPQKLSPPKFFTASARTPANSEPEEKRPGFFRSLLAPAAPEPQTSTVADFLKQSRPTP